MKARIPKITTPPLPDELPKNAFISVFGNPCAFWKPENYWHAVSDLGIEGAERAFPVESRLRVIKKREDIDRILMNSTKYEDVFLRDYETTRCAGYWESIEDVPDCVISYIEGAGVNPISESLILEVSSFIYDELMNQPCVKLKVIYDPNASEGGKVYDVE